jgi:hypothetical protein
MRFLSHFRSTLYAAQLIAYIPIVERRDGAQSPDRQGVASLMAETLSAPRREPRAGPRGDKAALCVQSAESTAVMTEFIPLAFFGVSGFSNRPITAADAALPQS